MTAQRRAEFFARRAGLPTRGQVQGVITVVQEDRFRVQDEQGRGYLFTLGRSSGVDVRDLSLWSGRRALITVEYDGPPDLGAVASHVRATDRLSGRFAPTGG